MPYRFISSLETGEILSTLEIEDLHAHVVRRNSTAKLLNGVSLAIDRDEVVGLIGETGAGKSLTAWATVGLLEPPVQVVRGRIEFLGTDLLSLSEDKMRHIRGRKLGLIVQNPRGSLNPMRTVGKQLQTAYLTHNEVNSREATDHVVRELEAVGIPDPERRAKGYPHEMSGGMAQRVLIAMAMMGKPDLLIADEPTTGLDLTVQAQILDLIRARSRATQASALLITHDLGVVANYCDRVAVMFAGRIVEQATTREIFLNPQHPYTAALINSVPERLRIGQGAPVAGQPPDLENLPDGCHYAPRCEFAETKCSSTVPLVQISSGHSALCHFPWRADVGSG